MKKLLKIVIATLCLCLIVACGTRNEKVNLKKTGKKYSTDQGQKAPQEVSSPSSCSK